MKCIPLLPRDGWQDEVFKEVLSITLDEFRRVTLA